MGFVQSGAAREEGAGWIGVGEHGVAQPTERHGIGGAGGGAGGGIGQGLGLKAGADGRGVQRARETAGFVERAAPAGAGRGVVRSEEKLRLLGLARQPVEVDVDRLFLPVDKVAYAGGVGAARVNHGDVAPLAGTDRGSDGADDDRISGVALAQAEFDLAVDEAQFAAAAVGGIVGGADVIDRGKQGDIAGIGGVRVEPKSEGEAGLRAEIKRGGRNFRGGLGEIGAPRRTGDTRRIGLGGEERDAGVRGDFGAGGGEHRFKAGRIGGAPLPRGAGGRELGVECGQLAGLLGESGLVGAGRSRDHRDRVGDAAIFPALGGLVEKSEQAVVIALGNRIKFMVVAFRALHGEAKPRGAEGADAVGDVFDAVFFLDDAALGIDDVVAREAGGDALLEGGLRQEIARDLFGDEAIVGEIGVEGVDHPVAPAPHRARRVVVEAVGVGVARGVEPLDGLPFAVVGRGEQAVDGVFVGGFWIFDYGAGKGVEFSGSRWQADEIEAGAAQPCLGGGGRGRGKILAGEAGQDEGVDGVAGELSVES